jgi:hypothetical protein
MLYQILPIFYEKNLRIAENFYFSNPKNQHC